MRMMMKSKKLIFGLIAAVVIIGGVYVGGCVYFNDHFYLNSTINGVKSSGRSAETVEEAIAEAAKDYSIDIVDEGRGATYTIFAEDVDMVTDVASSEVDTILSEQTGLTWPAHIIHRTEYDTDHVVTMDREKLKKEVEALPCMSAEDIVKTENAGYELEGDAFVVTPEVFGTQIDADVMTDIVMKKMESLTREMGLLADHCYVEPDILSDDEKLNTLVDNLNKKMAANITFTLDKDVTIDKETQASFLTTKDTTVDYDINAITLYVSELAARVNTFGQNKKLKTSYDKTITVPGGTYGWKVDEAAEVEAIIADLEAGEDVSRELHYTYYANSHGKNDYGNSYIEVNLTAQHLFFYKNGKLVLESDVVTGNPSKGNGTHTGAYFVAYKEKDATLNGANYSTPVSYWMPFHGNEGLHDATWRSSFGGTIYKYNGSHGCVNCPFETAKTIFENIDDGYPVLVYELEGTERSGDERARASSVITAIDAIGPVTLESETAIVNARQSYEALSETAKGYVTNITVLEEAEKSLDKLKADAEKAAKKSSKKKKKS